MLVSDMAVLYGNYVFFNLGAFNQKAVLQFFVKDFVFQKIYDKVKVLKTLKISTDCHIKMW